MRDRYERSYQQRLIYDSILLAMATLLMAAALLAAND